LRNPVVDPDGDTVTIDLGDLPEGTAGRYVLTATNAYGDDSAVLEITIRNPVPVVGLVLAGGGSKGAFEVGAVRCLYDVFGVNPSIIAGTSVGALNAAKLSEGRAAFIELEALWEGLRTDADLYLKPGWFQTLEPTIAGLLEAVSGRCWRTSPSAPSRPFSTTRSASSQRQSSGSLASCTASSPRSTRSSPAASTRRT
jgi:hypothetical protein